MIKVIVSIGSGQIWEPSMSQNASAWPFNVFAYMRMLAHAAQSPQRVVAEFCRDAKISGFTCFRFEVEDGLREIKRAIWSESVFKTIYSATSAYVNTPTVSSDIKGCLGLITPRSSIHASSRPKALGPNVQETSSIAVIEHYAIRSSTQSRLSYDEALPPKGHEDCKQLTLIRNDVVGTEISVLYNAMSRHTGIAE